MKKFFLASFLLLSLFMTFVISLPFWVKGKDLVLPLQWFLSRELKREVRIGNLSGNFSPPLLTLKGENLRIEEILSAKEVLLVTDFKGFFYRRPPLTLTLVEPQARWPLALPLPPLVKSLDKVVIQKGSVTVGSSNLTLEGEWLHPGERRENFNGTLAAASLAMADIPLLSKWGTPLSFELKGSWNQEGGEFREITFHMASLEGSGSGKIGADQSMEISLITNSFPLSEVPLLASLKILAGKGSVKLNLTGPLTRPEEWDLSGTLSADPLVLGSQNFSQVTLLFGFRKPTLTVKSFDGTWAENHLEGSGTGDFSGPQPFWELDLTGNNVNFSPLLEKGFGLPTTLQGKGNFEFKIKWGETLLGEGKLKLDEGSWSFGNLVKKLIHQPLATTLGSPLPLFIQKPISFPFGGIEIPFTLVGGEIQFSPLPFSEENQLFTLGGSISLDRQFHLSGEYLLNKIKTDSWITNPAVRSSLVDSEGRLKIPFTVSGPIEAPLIAADLEYLRSQIRKTSATPTETRPWGEPLSSSPETLDLDIGAVPRKK